MSYIDDLRASEYVKEKDLGEGISSFNFTRDAFMKGIWDEQTIHARGLFIDTNSGEIVARSYDKFFAIGERPETQMGELKKNLKFPVRAYRKENGFLGIFSGYKGKPFIASKSTNQGEFAERFARILKEQIGEEMIELMANELEAMHCSAVFEVIDPIEDPHIVWYDHAHCILLDIVTNDYKYRHLSTPLREAFARIYGLKTKSCGKTIDNWEEFELFLRRANQEDWNEGYVLEDANGFMLKIKNDWYKFWKKMRSVSQAIVRGKDKQSIIQKYGIKQDDPYENFVFEQIFNQLEGAEVPLPIPDLRGRIDNLWCNYLGIYR